jgi:hypothetical protein
LLCSLDLLPSSLTFGQIANVTLRPPDYREKQDFTVTMVPQNKTKIYHLTFAGEVKDGSGFEAGIQGATV